MRIRRRWGVIIGCAAAFSLLGCDGGGGSTEGGETDVVSEDGGANTELPVAGTSCETKQEAVCFDENGGVICTGLLTWSAFSAGPQGRDSDCEDEYYCVETEDGYEFGESSICIGFAGVSVAGSDRTIHRSLRTV